MFLIIHPHNTHNQNARRILRFFRLLYRCVYIYIYISRTTQTFYIFTIYKGILNVKKNIEWIYKYRIWPWPEVNCLRKVTVFASLRASDPSRNSFVPKSCNPIKTGQLGSECLPAVLQNTVWNVISIYDKMNSHIALTSRSGNPFFAQTDGRTESNYFKKPDNLCGFKT